MDTNETTPLRAVALVCTLSPSPKPSSSQLLAEQAMAALAEHGVTGKVIRVADHDVKPGVEADMGDGDAWPEIRQVILGADILILSTPIWLGHASSIAQRVLERLDAEISETDDEGRLLTYGKVAGVCVVGNEDGAHKVSADLFQGLNDVGFSSRRARSPTGSARRCRGPTTRTSTRRRTRRGPPRPPSRPTPHTSPGCSSAPRSPRADPARRPGAARPVRSGSGNARPEPSAPRTVWTPNRAGPAVYP